MPGDVVSALDVSGFAPVYLPEVMEHAAQLTRVDRKYLVQRDVAETFLRGLPEAFRVLTIDSRRSTSYSSVYYDTGRLDACRHHVQRRRRRWKVRQRSYIEDGLHRVEVKTRDGRGLTEKAVVDADPVCRGSLSGGQRRFVAEVLAGKGFHIDVADLGPSLEVGYERVTLADTDQSLRVTLDVGLECRLGRDVVWMDPAWVLVETKGGMRPSTADRMLIALGPRPRPFSKYVSAVSLLRQEVADNDVRRLLGRVLHTAHEEATREQSA